MLIKVNKYFPSSKKCFLCGNIKETLELNERTYSCECGNVIDRDYNAEEEQNKQLAMISA